MMLMAYGIITKVEEDGAGNYIMLYMTCFHVMELHRFSHESISHANLFCEMISTKLA